MKRIWVVGIIVLAFAGLADSFYLAEHEVSGTPLICNVQNLTGCNIVANSEYSHIFGIPVANVSVVLYSIIFIFAILELVLFDRILRRVIQGGAVIGLVISIISAFIQVFIIHALCIYCLASGVISILIFACASRIEPLRINGRQREPVPSSPSIVKDPLSMPPA